MKDKVFTAVDINHIMEAENKFKAQLQKSAPPPIEISDDEDINDDIIDEEDEEDEEEEMFSANRKPSNSIMQGEWAMVPGAENKDIRETVKLSLEEIETLLYDEMEKFKNSNQLSTNTNMEKAALDKVISELKVIFDCKDFIITGSYALAKYGLLAWKDVNDLDILLIEPTDTAKEQALRCMERQPAKSKPKEKAKDALGLFSIFIWQGIKVDVFIVKAEDFVVMDDNKFASIPHIIEAKRQCNRIKDWVCLRNIARQFFIDSDFQKYLNTNPVFTSNQEDYA